MKNGLVKRLLNSSFYNPFFDDSFFDDFFEFSQLPIWKIEEFPISNSYAVFEEDGKFVLHFKVPGVKKEDLNINIDKNNVLSVKFNRNEAIDDKKYGDFIYRNIEQKIYSYKLNEEELDIEKIESTLENGILTITIPKILKEAKKIENRKIEIK